MGLTSILTKLFSKKVHPIDQPCDPTPPQHQPNAIFDQIPDNTTSSEGSFTEAEADIDRIEGIGIGFGTQNITQVGADSNTRHVTQRPSYLSSSGTIVSKIEDVGGFCELCQDAVAEQVQAGQISVQQAQLLSLYDNNSGAICDACGFQGCIRHIRPVQTESGILMICETCQKQLQKQLRTRKIIGFLLSPFTEDPNK